MRVLHFTAMWPTRQNPTSGTFVKTLVDGLQRTAGQHDVLVVPAAQTKSAYLAAFASLRRRLRLQHYDLIHAQYAHCALIAALVSPIPVIAHYHGEFGLRDGNRGFADWRLTLNHLDNRKDTVLARLSSMLVRGAIVVNSRDLNRIASPFRAVIPIGPDEELFVPMLREKACALLRWNPSPLRVLFPSSPRRIEKDYPLFTKTVEELRRQGLDVEPVVLEGVPYDRVPLYMDAVDLMLLTSHTEASATVVKEANLCNLPVVACPVGDTLQQLAGISPGGVVAALPEELAAAASSILLARTRSNGRATAITTWGLKQTVRKVLDFYRCVTTGEPREQ